jgi:hypothetical protein
VSGIIVRGLRRENPDNPARNMFAQAVMKSAVLA